MATTTLMLLASIASFVGFAGALTVFILALVRARHRGRALVVAGASAVLAGDVVGEFAQASVSLLGSSDFDDAMLTTIQTTGILANLITGVGILLLAIGLVRGHRSMPAPLQQTAPGAFPAPPAPQGPYPPYQGWPPPSPDAAGPGAPGDQQTWGQR